MRRFLIMVVWTMLSIPQMMFAEDYYLVGDWNDWKSTKTFKLQPVSGQDGVYSLYINASVNHQGEYALGFIVAPSSALNDADSEGKPTVPTWDKCFRPKVSEGNFIVENNSYEGTCVKGGDQNWRLKRNYTSKSNANCGGCYLFTFNANDQSWKIENMPDIRVLYYVGEDTGWEFNGQYLTDTNNEKHNYNNNYYGFIKKEQGKAYKLTDGYSWFGQRSKDNVNNSKNNSNNKFTQQVGGVITEEDRYTENVPFELETKRYYVEANVLVINESYDLGAARKDVIWEDASGNSLLKHLKVYVKKGEQSDNISDYEEMGYDEANNIWYARHFELETGEQVSFRERYMTNNGEFNSDYSTNNGTENDKERGGTYKVIYKDVMASGASEPVKRLWLTVTANKTDDGKFIRTFSDWYPRIIPQNLKVYYATAYENKTLTLTAYPESDLVIPSCEQKDHIMADNEQDNPGWILVYDGEVAEESEASLHYDIIEGDENALEVSLAEANEEGKTYDDNKYWIKPFLKNEDILPADYDGGTVSFRNYYFTKYGGALGFYRSKSEPSVNDGGKITRKSYLHIPATVQVDGDNEDLATNPFYESANGAKFVNIAFIEAGQTDGISVNERESYRVDGAYYTLQGVKVSKPTQGLYIHKGKKIIVK